jgi:hypothetical protein
MPKWTSIRLPRRSAPMLSTIAVAVAVSQRARYSNHNRPPTDLSSIQHCLHSQRNDGMYRGCALIPFLSRMRWLPCPDRRGAYTELAGLHAFNSSPAWKPKNEASNSMLAERSRGTWFGVSRPAPSSIPLRILQRRSRGIVQFVFSSFADASMPASFAASTPRRGRE